MEKLQELIANASEKSLIDARDKLLLMTDPNPMLDMVFTMMFNIIVNELSYRESILIQDKVNGRIS